MTFRAWVEMDISQSEYTREMDKESSEMPKSQEPYCGWFMKMQNMAIVQIRNAATPNICITLIKCRRCLSVVICK